MKKLKLLLQPRKLIGKILDKIFRRITNRLDTANKSISDVNNKLGDVNDKLNKSINDVNNKLGNVNDKLNKSISDVNNKLDNNVISLKEFIHAKSKLQCFLLASQGKPRMFLFSTPRHGNLGDQAISMGELKIYSEAFPNYSTHEVSFHEYYHTLEELLIVIQPEDLIFIHGGGNFGNLYKREEDIRNSIVYHFPNNKIISMGQSVTFLDNGDDALETSQEIYKQHKNFHIVGRDELSFERIKEYFPTNKHYLCPDSVLFLEEDYQNISPRELDVLFTLRDDMEKVRSDDFLSSIESYVNQHNISSDRVDTHFGVPVGLIDRDKAVNKILKKISSAKINITDRYHGVIFSVITGTPVIALKSFDHKIPEGMKWFKHLDWVHYVENGDDIIPLVEKYLDPDYKVKHKFIFKELILNTYKNME